MHTLHIKFEQSDLNDLHLKSINMNNHHFNEFFADRMNSVLSPE